MSSPVDICNEALAELATHSTITSLDDPSVEAVNCKIFYDSVRQALLRTAPWGCSRAQIDLSLIGTQVLGTSDWPWLYKYEYPANCVKLRYIVMKFPTTNAPVVNTGDQTTPFLWVTRRYPFIISTGVDSEGNQTKYILCNVPNAVGIFNYNTQNTDLFDPLFRQALVYGLVSKLVMPLSGNTYMRRDFEQLAQARIDAARAADGNEALPKTDHIPDWIRARGWPSDSYYGPGNTGYGLGGNDTFCESYDSMGWGS